MSVSRRDGYCGVVMGGFVLTCFILFMLVGPTFSVPPTEFPVNLVTPTASPLGFVGAGSGVPSSFPLRKSPVPEGSVEDMDVRGEAPEVLECLVSPLDVGVSDEEEEEDMASRDDEEDVPTEQCGRSGEPR